MDENQPASKAAQELFELKAFIAAESHHIKPYFGLLFWEFHHLGLVLPPEDDHQEHLSLVMNSEDDEVLARFLAAYINIWGSARDFNAANRFVASALEMTADELFQCRQLWLDQRGS